MSKHQQNKTVFYDIRPPYGAVFQMNADGSVKLVFDPSKPEEVRKWAEEVGHSFEQIAEIALQQQKMAESPLDRPVKLAIKTPPAVKNEPTAEERMQAGIPPEGPAPSDEEKTQPSISDNGLKLPS